MSGRQRDLIQPQATVLCCAVGERETRNPPPQKNKTGQLFLSLAQPVVVPGIWTGNLESGRTHNHTHNTHTHTHTHRYIHRHTYLHLRILPCPKICFIFRFEHVLCPALAIGCPPPLPSSRPSPCARRASNYGAARPPSPNL